MILPLGQHKNWFYEMSKARTIIRQLRYLSSSKNSKECQKTQEMRQIVNNLMH